MVGGVVVGMSLCPREGMSEAVCVLPHTLDGQLPVSELHFRPGGRALRFPARLLAEQPHHRTQGGLLRLRDTGKPGLFLD